MPLERCLEWFDTYTREWVDKADKDVLLLVQGKISHTMRVLAHVRGILKESNIDDDIALIAEVAAVLHDVGRFPQLVNSASYDDYIGYNHAEEGEKILRMVPVLEHYPENQREIVLTAVRHHNLAILPEGLSDDERTVLNILRNGDKLDAIRNVVKYSSAKSTYGKALKSGLIWHETEVSEDIVKLCLERKLIPFLSIKWSNDFAIFMGCWIYDMHFPYAFRTLSESGNFEKLMAWMPDDGVFEQIKSQLRSDLNRFIHQG